MTQRKPDWTLCLPLTQKQSAITIHVNTEEKVLMGWGVKKQKSTCQKNLGTFPVK